MLKRIMSAPNPDNWNSDHEVFAREVMTLFDIEGEPTIELLNLAAEYALACESEGAQRERLSAKIRKLEAKLFGTSGE